MIVEPTVIVTTVITVAVMYGLYRLFSKIRNTYRRHKLEIILLQSDFKRLEKKVYGPHSVYTDGKR